MRRFSFWSITLFCCAVYAQTDETIFREFRFDFTTPGARANALGKAFVGLADEATAAFNNPAGLTVLEHPEITLEFRNTNSQYTSLQEKSPYSLQNGSILEPESTVDRISFGSFSFSKFNMNFSIFFVNQLDYVKETTQDQTDWLHNDPTAPYSFSYLNFHQARMRLDTFGLGFGKRFKRTSFGGAVGFSRFDYSYNYFSRLTSEDLGLLELVDSEALGNQIEPSFVFGAHYHLTDQLRIGLAFKRQPKFHFEEIVKTIERPEEHAIPVTFKVPDSLTIGLSYLPFDRLTLLLDFNRIWYNQLVGENFTVISGNDYLPSDYEVPEVTESHFGIEYLWPVRGHIFAFRGGAYLNPDHKTRFKGTDYSYQGDVQAFVFNTGKTEDVKGFSLGLGYVWNNKYQIDFAYTQEEGQFSSLIISALYRFGKK